MRRLLVPGLTLTNLLMGFTALYLALQGQVQQAAYAVLLGGVLDVLDGFLARRWNLGTELGVQLDSLADVVTFGVAPAFIVGMATGERHLPSWITAAGYLAAVAWRLARYNVKHEVGDARQLEPARFSGMPSPAGAGFILAPILDGLAPPLLRASLPLLCVVAAGLMVSTLPYFHTRYYLQRVWQGGLRERALALGLFLLWLWVPYPWSFLFGGYTLTGLLNYLRKPRLSQTS